ncbi:DsbA family protein [Alteromonadaceae bacterium BrNp21-10]|nr:DsbA family protein [Alteromonadaceae bacterium BrNp21-10]
MTKIEFFHDAVCGWCYLLSPRLRRIATKYQIEIEHRSFVLQRTRAEMVARFGSMESAKTEILNHWQQCKEQSETPEKINIQGMRRAQFEYPSGLNAALAAKAVEAIAGHQAHWDFFDAVQNTHLQLNQNIADINVLLALAEGLGISTTTLFELMFSQRIQDAVSADNVRARQFHIRSIPSLLINGTQVVSQTLTEPMLEKLFSDLSIKTLEETTS